MRKDHVNLRTLRNVLNKCIKNAQTARGMRVEFWIGEEEYRLKNIGQFGVLPDVVVELEKVE